MIDPMDNTLTIQLAFFGSAVPVALEAFKAKSVARLVLGVISAIFMVAGIAWPWIGPLLPALTNTLGLLATNPVTWFVLVVASFFIIRPIWIDTYRFGPWTKGRLLPLPPLDYTETDQLKSDIESLKVASKSWNEAVQTLDRLTTLPEKVEAIRVDTAIATRDVAKMIEERERFGERIRQSFHAIYLQKRLEVSAQEIERLAEVLYEKLRDGGRYTSEEWIEWEETLRFWESNVQDWVNDGRWYAHDVEKEVYEIDDRMYGEGNWSVRDNQVPGSEAMRRFKKHRLIYGQWRKVRPVVDRGVSDVAYIGLSEKDVQQRRVPK